MPREPRRELDVETVLVTGACGDVGAWVADRLAADGVAVVGLDRERPAGTRANLRVREQDLTEQGETWETIREVDPDAVVHLAAISDPGRAPATRVFRNNVQSAYNVLMGAGRADVPVVWTSSQAVYGALFAPGSWCPDYLPIDEAHPCRPADAYGLSKRNCEEVAATVARRFDVSVTTLRPATVFTPDRTKVRPHDDGGDLEADAAGGDFGSYVDVRDLAGLVEAALDVAPPGHTIVNAVADENYLGQPTAELVEAICGEVPPDTDLSGRQAAITNAAAKEIFDWEQRFTRRDGLEADGSTPDWR